MITDDDVIGLIQAAGLEGPDVAIESTAVRRRGRQRRQRRFAASGAAGTVIALAVAVAVVAPDGSAYRERFTTGYAGPATLSPSSTPTEPPQKQVRVTVDGGCPASIGEATDVSNPRTGLTHRLLPDAVPRDGLVCLYRGFNESLPIGTLSKTVRLTRPSTDRLASSLNQLSLKMPRGIHNCPNDSGAVNVIVLGYAGPVSDVDIWYHADGCQVLDNSYVSAVEVGNPSFYQGFENTFTRITR